MNIRLLLSLALFVCLVQTTYAQVSVSKQINDIKRDDRYFYAESTLENADQAKETAMLMLANFINDYINEHNLPADKKVKEGDLAQAQMLSMQRGPMTRVFLYVAKDNFIGDNGSAMQVTQESTVSDSDEQAVSTEQQKSGSVEEKESAPVVNTQSAPKQDSPVVGAESKMVSVVKETVPSQQANASAGLSKEWQREVVDKILSEPSLKEIIAVLSRYKAEYKVKKYGTMQECNNAAGSLWIICEGDSSMALITVLGPGADVRTNFKTGQNDSLANYSGKSAVWFEFAN